MKPRSRSEPVFIDIAFSMAALPARISSGFGGVQIGCHQVIAIPHCAMAHLESRSPTAVKTRRASSEKNEWSNATPRAKSDWTSGVHVIGNVTFPTPRKSPGSGAVAALSSSEARKQPAQPARKRRPHKRNISDATFLRLLLQTRSLARHLEIHLTTS